MARDHPPRVTPQVLPKRKSRNYPKSSVQKDTFSFRSEGEEGVNLHDAYVDTIRDLEGINDRMFEGYGAKVTYIVMLSTKEHLKQMNAQTANGPITRVKVVKQIARIVWDAIREECVQVVNGKRANPTIDLLKPWYLMKLDRVGKAAFLCTLGQCSTDGTSHTTAASDTLSSSGVGSSVYSSNGDTTSGYFVPADNSSPMFVTSGPSPGPHQTYLSTIAGIPNIGDFPPDQSHTGASLQIVPSGSLHIPSQLNLPIVPDANPSPNAHSIIAPSPPVNSCTATSALHSPQNLHRGVDVPLDTSEWVQLNLLVARARNTTGMVFSISFPAVSGPASAHRDVDGRDTSPLEQRNLPITHEVHAHFHADELDVQTSRIEPQGSTSLTGVCRCEQEQELRHADATSTGTDNGPLSGTDECDDFNEDTDDWPIPGFRSTPHKWECKERLVEIASVRQYEEAVDALDCLFPDLLIYLCERFPEERSGLSASRDLEVQCYDALDVYYKPLEGRRGQRSIRRQLQWDGFAVATNSTNERAYCSVYGFLRVILPSGHTTEVANVSWLKPGVCNSGTTSSNRQIFDGEDDRSVFIDVKSIIRSPGTDKFEYERCGDCDKQHCFGPRGKIV